jgi:hypothetical protein
MSALVIEARRIADVNSQLMKLNKQRYMERDLLQRECDAQITKINKNDAKIRKLVEELKLQDQWLSASGAPVLPDVIPEEVDERPVGDELQDGPEPHPQPRPPQPPVSDEQPDREALLLRFFESSVDVLCRAVVKVLGVIDPAHEQDYESFHEVFGDFDGRKKELRFLMSKLGNLSFHPETEQRMPEVALPDVEGGDEDVAAKQILEPQRRAFMEFAQPVAPDEFPELIATHFFQ